MQLLNEALEQILGGASGEISGKSQLACGGISGETPSEIPGEILDAPSREMPGRAPIDSLCGTA